VDILQHTKVVGYGGNNMDGSWRLNLGRSHKYASDCKVCREDAAYHDDHLPNKQPSRGRTRNHVDFKPLCVCVEAAPDADTAFVDSVGLDFIQGGLSQMLYQKKKEEKNKTKSDGPLDGASALYHWLGLDGEDFPDPVKRAVTAPLEAKYHAYGKEKSKQSDPEETLYSCVFPPRNPSNAIPQKHCIHVAEPDLRSKVNTPEARGELVRELAKAYHNVFVEFCTSHLKGLRLVPVGAGIHSGAFKEDMPEITAEAVKRGFQNLEEEQKRIILQGPVEMCIFSEHLVAKFEEAFVERRSTVTTSKL